MPLFSEWIIQNRQFSESELSTWLEKYSEHFDDFPNLDEELRAAAKYKGHSTLEKHIGVMLSEDGIAWLKEFYNQVNKVKPKQ
jgi:hypothetical protein